MKTAIVVDTASYLPEKLKNHPDVYTLDITLTFADGTMYPDTADIQMLRAFFDKLETSAQLPTTSQPILGEYIELVDAIIEKGYEQIFCVHLSSGISGTYATACVILESVKDRIAGYCIDSKSASVVIVELVKEILLEVEEGYSGEEIYENIQWMVEEAQTYLKVENLTNLVKGGRISPTLEKIAGVLKVRPVLRFDETGEIVLYEKARSDKIVTKRWTKLANKAVKKYGDQLQICIAHADALREVNAIIEYLNDNIDYKNEYEIGVLGSAVANYTGKRSIGFVLIPRPMKKLQK
ncbi:DegV family protein [Allofustis seminis]|uniref:DegV family protein n=1 Tax=Allofustis seminis TaxID=166939 RepID=UPI0003684A1C|nr:DegV family protein [Allofustis seminis]